MRPKAEVTWTRHDARRTLIACMGLTGAAELAHRRLCDHFWSTRQWAPVETGCLAALVKNSRECVPGILQELATIGWRIKDDTLVNPEVKAILHEALAARSANSSKARTAARKRWSEPELTVPPQPTVPPDAPSIAQAMLHALPQAMPDACQYSTVHNSTLNAVKAERLTRSVLPREAGAQDESTFFEQLETVLKPIGARKTRLELENWGGWWRNRFRENPDKAQRVIDDVANMVKEGRILKSFGAAAVDLWSRLPT
jgi:hypothetical protein